LALLPQQERDNSTKLMDHNDLFVLDLAPSLKTLAMLQVTKNGLNTDVSLPTVSKIVGSRIFFLPDPDPTSFQFNV
jgi:hypothetical protein